ncbi:adenylate/guanylate cyclase domain-containing protein [Corynebacterium sp. ACRQM]|uniref:adenylate/guanylate cyclase domain-containing protein n=1 Tax=unclassified Corynebacterium TaxID=2624378 RepID=UPI001EF41CB3|nr:MULTISPECIES: adenylate/guanylate cyclase domain-containing protein [unclassified Corynebacterium]MCG7233193.1 adenylate/guanylate cyclase domain-containing protein [Corynebacterium sp. ACRPR]MCG7242844.1 adenylate/guanylate cyclase domain-containing protein [Corynebacterium sp. ACRPS]MCG7271400.1 adenylate/guanylate cyclase domain-containing protein [Corynebacterium sp. ACRQM]MDK8815515.1 adenylate/guanylate cyclase domain-containing protein [Corynebacterium sp. MSK073]
MNRLLRGARWLMGTQWPVYAALVLGANLIGAIAIMTFILYFLPMPEIEDFAAELPNLKGVAAVYLIFAVIIGIAATLLLFRPVLDWQRNPDAHDPNMVRTLVLRIPVYQSLVAAAVWLIGIILTVAISSGQSGRLGLVVGVSTTLAGLVVIILTYLQAERLVRPVAAQAVARRFEDSTVEPPIKYRLFSTWLMTSGVPLLGIVLVLLGQHTRLFSGDASEIIPAIVALALTALATGFIGTSFAIMSVVDPIVELQDAINRVRRGEADAEVDIYDGSELGVLQAGFNEMMRGLRERQRVRDIFGRYVGTEVAQRALDERPELGGEDRKVAVLFIDVIGSTTFAVNHSPEEVVTELNKFFEHVVTVVHRNKGIINKFQGDAALAVFGAPLNVYDSTSMALQAARELRGELRGLELQAGIGVASGHVVAGHIGGADRFEYTVIGDAVNEAARLTEMAKDTPGQVLTNAATLKTANEAEQARWTVMKSIELRGRRRMTQLARPIRASLAERCEI